MKDWVLIWYLTIIEVKNKGQWELPAKMECFTKEDNTRKGSNSNPCRLEHANKYRSFPFYAPCRYRKCHRASCNSLQYCFPHTIRMSIAINPRVGLQLVLKVSNMCLLNRIYRWAYRWGLFSIHLNLWLQREKVFHFGWFQTGNSRLLWLIEMNILSELLPANKLNHITKIKDLRNYLA